MVKNQNETKDQSSKRGLNLLIIIFIFFAFLIAVNYGKEKELSADNLADFTKVAVIEDYQEALEGDELKIFYFSKPTCGYCEAFQPTLFEVVTENDLEVYYVDVSSIGSDIEIIVNSHEDLAQFGTPTVVIIENKEVIGVNIGMVEKETLVSFFEEYNIIKGVD